MPPGKIDFSSFASDTLNDTDIPYVTGDEGFSVKMRSNYQDAQGFPYQTNYCLSCFKVVLKDSAKAGTP